MYIEMSNQSIRGDKAILKSPWFNLPGYCLITVSTRMYGDSGGELNVYWENINGFKERLLHLKTGRKTILLNCVCVYV